MPAKIRTMSMAAVAGLLVAGCNPMSPHGSAGSNRACLADNPRFADAWACVRARLAARQDAGRDGLLQEGDLLAAQVRAGKVPETEARRRLGAGLAHETDN